MNPQMSEEDFLSQYSYNPNRQQQPETEEDIFLKQNTPSQYQIDKRTIEESEDSDLEIERHLARLTSRGIEQVVGLPGNVRELAKAGKNLVQGQLEKDPFKRFLKKKGIDLKEPDSPAFKALKPVDDTIGKYINMFPTSQEVKGFSEKITGGYTKPQGKMEEIGDEIFENIVSAALPGQGPRNVYKNIAAPIAGVLGKEAVKYLGAGDKSQFLTQLGLNIVIPLMGGNAPQYNQELWRDLERNVPNTRANAIAARQRAMDLIHDIEVNGLGSAGEREVARVAQTFLNNTSNGQMSARQLVGMNRSLNEIAGDPTLMRGSRNLLNQIRDMIQTTGKQFERLEPNFYKSWKTANEVHGAIKNSDFIAMGIEKASRPLVSEGARALFGAAVHGTAKAAGTLPPLYAIYKGVQIITRMGRSPELMRYYTNVLTNSLRGNIAQVSSNLDKLDKALLKEEEKNSKLKPPFKTQKK